MEVTFSVICAGSAHHVVHKHQGPISFTLTNCQLISADEFARCELARVISVHALEAQTTLGL